MSSASAEAAPPSSFNTHAYQFDPNATPEQKKDQVLGTAPAGLKTEKTNRGEEIVGDTSALPKMNMPPPSAMPASEQESTKGNVPRDAKIGCNGSEIPAEVIANLLGEMAGGGDRVSRSNFIKDEENPLKNELTGRLETNSRDHTTALEQFLPEGTFGDWYHNTGIMIFCALSCWLVGRLGGGLAWIIIVGAFCATYYRTSIRRVRRNARDDITRDLAKTRLETEYESAEWMNSFLTKFWIIYEPVLSTTIVSTVDQVLATSTPAMLDSMRLAFFTLGTKPPRIDHVQTYPKSDDDIVLMDWRFSFTPNDTWDLTARQLKNKVNPRIELAIRVGTSMAAATLPIIVEDIAFSGLMQVKIKLMTEFPHIKIVDLSFLEKPEIGYVLKPVGGNSLGFDIGIIPGLSGSILEMIHDTLSPMMYAPNVFTLNIQQMMSGEPLDSAIGVAVVTIHSAHGLRNPDIASGKPDPYVTIGTGHGEVSRTAVIKSEAEPRFNEVKTLLLTTLKDPLAFEVFDYNEVRKDKSLGIATYDLNTLDRESDQEHISEALMSQGKSRGNLDFSINWFPVLVAPKLDDGSVGDLPESDSGIVRFTVHQAKNLGGGKSTTPYACLTLDSKEIGRSPKMKHTNNPVWDFSKEILVTDKNKCILGVQIRSDDVGADTVLGAHQISLLDLMAQNKKEVDNFLLKDSKDPHAKIKISAIWKPVAMTGIVGGASYLPPIGALRVEFRKAVDLRNPEIGLGKADPYMRVLVNGSQKGRTITIKNEQNPEWNEVLYIPIRNARESVVFEVMDYQQRTKDRSLGQIKLDTSDLILLSSDGSYSQVLDASVRTAKFSGRDAKGKLFFTTSFYPAMSVMTKEEEEANSNDVSNASLPSTPTIHVDCSDAPSNPYLEKPLGRDRSLSTTTTRTTGSRRNAIPKVRLLKEDLHKYQSGFLVFELLEGILSVPGSYLQVLFDDYHYPAYITQKARSLQPKWNETGEGFIRELDFSRITLRINKEAASQDDDNIVAQASDLSLEVLRRSFHEICTQKLKNGDGHVTKISFRCHFIPVPMSLDPSESVNNQGKLQISVISGRKLLAADRGGKSDPYAKFYITGEKDHVYKTATIKKTLNPDWNENFECSVHNRLASAIKVDIMDWDALGEDDDLGSVTIPLAGLEPMQLQDMELNLLGNKGADGKSGSIKLRILFLPEFVNRSQRSMTKPIAGLLSAKLPGSSKVDESSNANGSPIDLKKGRSFIGSRMHLGGRKSGSSAEVASITRISENETLTQDGSPPGPPLSQAAGSQQNVLPAIVTPPSAQTNGHTRQLSSQSSRMQHDNVILTVRIKSGSGCPDRKTLLRVKTKSGHSFGKTDPFKGTDSINAEMKGMIVVPDELEFSMLEYHTIGSDKPIASATLAIAASNSTTQAHTLHFSNGAAIEAELQYSAADAASLRSVSRFVGGSPFRKSTSGR